jgi:hypothetical protein
MSTEVGCSSRACLTCLCLPWGQMEGKCMYRTQGAQPFLSIFPSSITSKIPRRSQREGHEVRIVRHLLCATQDARNLFVTCAWQRSLERQQAHSQQQMYTGWFYLYRVLLPELEKPLPTVGGYPISWTVCLVWTL